MQSVVIHYQEIALKGKNRPWFVARLVKTIKEATRDLDIREVRALMGRIELVLGPTATWESVRDRVAMVFGVGNFAKAGRAPLDVDAIAAEILKDLGPENPATFRLSARRADKRFPLSSPEIERELRDGPSHAALQGHEQRRCHSARNRPLRCAATLRRQSRKFITRRLAVSAVAVVHAATNRNQDATHG